MEQPKGRYMEKTMKKKAKIFVHYKNKYIIDIKHKQNCIVPYTEIKLTTTTTIILCSVSFHEYFDIHLKFSNVAIRIST